MFSVIIKTLVFIPSIFLYAIIYFPSYSSPLVFQVSSRIFFFFVFSTNKNSTPIFYSLKMAFPFPTVIQTYLSTIAWKQGTNYSLHKMRLVEQFSFLSLLPCTPSPRGNPGNHSHYHHPKCRFYWNVFHISFLGWFSLPFLEYPLLAFWSSGSNFLSLSFSLFFIYVC